MVVGSLAARPVAFALFVRSSLRHRVPVLDRRCSASLVRRRERRHPRRLMGFYAYLLNNILWLPLVWDWSLLVAGLAVAPGAVVAAAVAGGSAASPTSAAIA